MNVNIIQLFISRISRLRTRDKLLLLELFSTVDNLMDLQLNDLEQILRRKLINMTYKPKQIREEVDEILNDIHDSDIKIVFYWDNEYPPMLREIYNPPFVLYKKGAKINHEIPSIAVVGTRKATVVASTAAYNLGLEMADLNIYLVSGLAAGIDKAAHEGSAKRQGQMIAVLGNGIDYIYPAGNSALGRKILESGGVILSEYPPGTPPLKYNFPARNRIISGLSMAVVIVEAPERSGALITAEFALEQGRDVYVHRCSLNSRMGAGCRKLLLDGAGIVDYAHNIVSFKEAV